MFWTVPLSVNRSYFSLASSIRADVLILLASCQQNLYDMHHCCVHSEKLLMMDRETVRNM